MANVFQLQGDYEKALEYCRKALVIRERVFGTGHPSTAETYINMAFIYRAQGDYEKALGYFKKANAVFQSVLGENHPHTRNTALGIEIMELCMMTGMTEYELMELFKNSPPSEE